GREWVCGGQDHAQGIVVDIVDAKLVVQVRAGGKPRRADEADDIPLRDTRALANTLREPRQVPVPGRVMRLVAQDDQVAVATLAPGEFDDAVAGGLDARAGRGDVVYALVRAPLLQDRMEPGAREAGGNA